MIVFFVLARDDIRAGFAIVPEAHAMIVTRFGAFEKLVVNWHGHVGDQEHNVIERPGAKRMFGGLIFFRFPIEDVKLVQEDEDKKTAKISLKTRVIQVEIDQAEDLEGVQTRLQGYIEGRIVNPYKITYGIESPWMPKLKEIFESAMRDAITERAFLTAIREKKDMATKMWQVLKEDKVIEEWKGKYGFEAKRFGIRKISIQDPGNYETLLEQWKGTRAAEGIEARAKGEANALRIKARAVQELGDEGRLLVITEAMAKSSLAAAETVHAIPGLGLDQLVGGSFKRTDKEDLQSFLKGFHEELKGDEDKGGKKQ